MGFVSIGRHGGLATAHAHPDVQTIASVARDYPIASIFELLWRALYSSGLPLTDMALKVLAGTAKVPATIEKEALKLAASAMALNRVGTVPMVQFYRGVVLEAVAESLARRWATTVVVEEAVEGMPVPKYSDGRSKPFDVVVKAEPTELIECKAGIGLIDQDDIDVFDDSVDALAAAGQAQVRSCLLTLATTAQLRDRVRNMTCRHVVHGVGRDALSQFATGPAREVVLAASL